MAMQLCSRCHKRAAVVFITKFENGKSVQEGLCLRCAKELGITQVDNVLQNMGISDEDIDNMENEMNALISGGDGGEVPDGVEETESRAPAIDFAKLFGGIPPFGAGAQQGAQSTAGGAKNAESGKKEPKKPARKFLSLYCKDLTASAREGKLDAVIGRERETERMMQILTRRQKNNPCLIGEPGVGKTAIAEALAQKIAGGEVPYKLRDKEVFLVDLTALVAGTQFRGQFESRMKGLVDEVKALGNIILVIDEVHSIVGVGDSEGSMNAANILKPSLSR